MPSLTKTQLLAENQALRKSLEDESAIRQELEQKLAEALEQLQNKNSALIEAHTQVTEALERQTATSEILRVISRSPTDVQPVFDAIVRNAVRLSGALHGSVYRFDGERVHPLAHDGYTPEQLDDWKRTWPRPVTAASAACQSMRTRSVVRIADHETAPELLEARNAELTETLARQTATGEVLRAISRAQTNAQPVFDIIAANALRLGGANYSAVALYDGEWLHVVALENVNPEGAEMLRRAYPRRADQSHGVGRAVRAARSADPRRARRSSLLRNGEPIGGLSLGRAEPGLFSDTQVELLKTFADQAVIAIENVRLFTELQASNHELTTALDTQTATSDILRVISQSQTDVQPVFDAIVVSAVRLLGAYSGALSRIAGDQLELAALTSTDAAGDATLRALFPQSIHSEGTHAQVIRARVPLNIADAHTDPRLREATHASARGRGYQSLVVVPLLRHDEAVGTIAVTRREAGGFTDDEIALLKTFADQAVIAIENARLLTELQTKNADLTEALKQQTATGEILRVISSSPTDVQPVFDTIVERAVRLCYGLFGGVLRFDGELVHIVAHHNISPTALAAYQRILPMQASRSYSAGRAILDRAVANIPDIEADPDLSFAFRDAARLVGYRSMISVPMLQQGRPIGVINVAHRDVAPFSETHIQLLQTFADQAVIAIENVRLFTELQEKNQALTQAHAQVTDALEQQTATSEILGVISSSPTDVHPVFDTIARSARRLCGADSAALVVYDGELIRIESQDNANPERTAALLRAYPMPATRGHAIGRVILTGQTIHIPDVRQDSEYALAAQDIRSVLAVPMLRDGMPIGGIAVHNWLDTRPFSDTQIELLRTFADQAVIAVENVRLFKELEARTQELTRSVGELQALGEVGQAISSTLDLQTVLRTIVARATQLADADAGVIYEYDEQREIFEPRATEHLGDDILQALVATPVRKGQGATGRLAEVREPIQLADVRAVSEQIPVRDVLIRAGYRALLAVPLVREDQLIGGLTVFRKTPGEFPADIVELLKTFATQSSLAIQNARLFREIEQKSRELETASRHKSEFLANMSHELRTPLNAIIGFSDVLTERMFGELNEKQDEYVKDISASGTHLLSLINDILDLSKIEAGRMELEVTEFDLRQAIDNALILVRERAGRRGIALHQVIEERLGEIRGDERKVKQVLLNLLSNALKFTPEGGRIDVRGGDCRRYGGDLDYGHRGRDRPGGPGGGVRAAWRPDLGEESVGRGLDVYVHAPGAAWRMN